MAPKWGGEQTPDKRKKYIWELGLLPPVNVTFKAMNFESLMRNPEMAGSH